MTMSSAVSKVTLNGDGVQTAWPFSFKVWKVADLEISITNAEGVTTVVSNWSVSLAGQGGTVTYPTSGPALPSGHKITIARSMDFLQDVDLVSGTRWDPEVMETALDKATAERQQLKEELSRAVKVDVSGTQTAEELKEDIFAARDAAVASAGASASFAAAAATSADRAEELKEDTFAARDAAVASAGASASFAAAAATSADRAEANQLAAEAISIEAAARAYNYIINGNFDIWQRGTSQTITGYFSADRWLCGNVGAIKTASRQAFTLGQTEVPDNPMYYMRHEITSVAVADNFCTLQHKIEGVGTFAAKKTTLSFWARADAARNIAIEFAQSFGTGGSPSARVLGIGAQQIALTTGWTKYTITVDIPSIAGKTLGAYGNDYFQLNFWFEAGSSYAFRTANLGHQSGTFDIACVSLVEGDIDVKPIPRSYGEELALCQRYYSTGFAYTRSHATDINQIFNTPVYFPVSMRTTPSLTLIDGGGRANTLHAGISTSEASSARHEIVSAAAGDCRALGDIWTADAEL